ncbi:MAG: pseudouridylate synthase [Pedobacter sp.]|nr:MAG: pseudouridylate synthase [Pedobacter sp.]
MFTRFKTNVAQHNVPKSLVFADHDGPHELCLLAAGELQEYLSQNQKLNHNFGLNNQSNSTIIGKMFGVLVVEHPGGEIGYLSAFSGKLGGKNAYPEFVPPVFDLLTEGSFLNLGMQELTRMNDEIQLSQFSDIKLAELKDTRRKYSNALQKQIFDHYQLLNQEGLYKGLTEIFNNAGYKNPPAGAAECAGIKLLQYAFLHHMKPLALGEFWWGKSPKSNTWKHGMFYPCCKEKCEPILKHMLS